MLFLQKIDARAKLFCILLLTIAVFLLDKLLAALCLLLFFIIIRLVVKAPFYGARYLKNLTLLAAFIILIQTIFGPGESYIVSPIFPSFLPVLGGMGSLKWEGFFLGIMIICRLAALALILPVFTHTTEPHQITAGLCALKINYRAAFVITSAFSFIHIFKNEINIIIDAQKMRAMTVFESQGSGKPRPFSGIRAYITLFVPLMLSAMRKARCSAIAMDARSFGVYKTRTWLDKPQMKKNDFLLITACFVLTSCVLILNYLI